jgi:ABC-type transport system involved in multi-copper enzyme maturation permease subunit
MMTVTLALIRDTFREALARKIFWALFGLSTLMIAFFLFLMRIDVVQGASATVSLFGRNAGNSPDVRRLVDGAYGGIATFLYTWSMFLAVFASAGLIPSVLEPGRIELLLSKPVTRMHILLGRFAGNVLVVSLNVTYLVISVWVIFGLRTGVWGQQFLVAIFTTVFVFAVLLSVVALVGVLFESPAVSTMVTVGMMIASPILAQQKMMMKLLSSEWSRGVWRTLYYTMPKVYDIGRMTLDIVTEGATTDYWMPSWTSALFGAIVLSAALFVFSRKDF